MGIPDHPKGVAPPFTDQNSFLLTFWPLFWSQSSRKTQSYQKGVEKVNKNGICSLKGKAIRTPLGCSVKLNYQLEIVGDESETWIDHYIVKRFFKEILLPCGHLRN